MLFLPSVDILLHFHEKQWEWEFAVCQGRLNLRVLTAQEDYCRLDYLLWLFLIINLRL